MTIRDAKHKEYLHAMHESHAMTAIASHLLLRCCHRIAPRASLQACMLLLLRMHVVARPCLYVMRVCLLQQIPNQNLLEQKNQPSRVEQSGWPLTPGGAPVVSSGAIRDPGSGYRVARGAGAHAIHLCRHADLGKNILEPTETINMKRKGAQCISCMQAESVYSTQSQAA